MIGILLGILTVEAAVDSGDLPSWKSDGATVPYFPGGGLWPDASLPKGGVAYIEKVLAPSSETEVAKTVPTEYVVLREEPGDIVAPFEGVEESSDLPPIDEALQKQFFGSKPTEYLIDPQGLVTEQKANDVLRFLEMHAEESRFVIYPVVLGKNQTVPDAIDLKQIHREWFGDRLAIMVVYHYLEPDSLEIVYNESLAPKIPATVFHKIRQNCVGEAKLADNGPDQLEKITIELSIQAFWLEKLMDREPLTIRLPAEETQVAVHAPAPIIEPVEAPVEIEEVFALPKPDPAPEPESNLIRIIVVGSSSILLLAVLLFLRELVVSRLSRKQEPILFPSFPGQPRLGGEFTGGAFIGISYDPGRSDVRID